MRGQDRSASDHTRTGEGRKPPAGDRIVAVDGRRTGTFTAVRDAIDANEGRALLATVERDGRAVTLSPRRPVQSEGRWVWGFVAAPELVSYPPGESARRAGIDCWRVVTGTVESVREVAGSGDGGEVSGPVGVVRASEQSLALGIPYYLVVLGVISMSLALFNLLPLLPLDGGHILVSLVEGVRGRAVPRDLYQRYSELGLALILLIYLISFMNDLGATRQ